MIVQVPFTDGELRIPDDPWGLGCDIEGCILIWNMEETLICYIHNMSILIYTIHNT